MQRSLLLVTLLSLVACSGAEPTAPAPTRAAEPTRTAEPAEPAPPAPAAAPASAVSTNDRSKDPAFALKKDGDAYVGLVLDRCPPGARIADRLRHGEPKLAGGKLFLELMNGGCPRWAGYTVVPGQGSPLPFYLCEDIAHDPCESLGTATWVFDIGDALEKSGATAVAYTLPPPA